MDFKSEQRVKQHSDVEAAKLAGSSRIKFITFNFLESTQWGRTETTKTQIKPTGSKLVSVSYKRRRILNIADTLWASSLPRSLLPFHPSLCFWLSQFSDSVHLLLLCTSHSLSLTWEETTAGSPVLAPTARRHTLSCRIPTVKLSVVRQINGKWCVSSLGSVCVCVCVTQWKRISEVPMHAGIHVGVCAYLRWTLPSLHHQIFRGLRRRNVLSGQPVVRLWSSSCAIRQQTPPFPWHDCLWVCLLLCDSGPLFFQACTCNNSGVLCAHTCTAD